MVLVIRIWIIGYCFGFRVSDLRFSSSSQIAEKLRPKALRSHCSSLLTKQWRKIVDVQAQVRTAFFHRKGEKGGWMDDVIMRVVMWAVPVVFSIVVHEVSHGWMAYRLGDDTAKRMGRLTLNPVPHIDPMGTVILPLIMIVMGGPVFGWAKPVPFNPYNFKRNVNIRTGAMWVALAGPASNLAIAFVSSFILVAAQKFLAGFPSVIQFSITQLAQAFIVINLVLASLNLIPIPPLDGSRILMRFLPPAYDRYFLMLERYGFLILLLLLATGAFSSIVWVPVEFLFSIFLLIPRLLFGVI